MTANSPVPQDLTAEVWFSYPQGDGWRSVVTGKTVIGTLQLREGSRLSLVTLDRQIVFDRLLADIYKVRALLGTALVFTFTDGVKFAVNFAPNLSPDRFRLSLFRWRPTSRLPSVEARANLERFVRVLTPKA